MAGRVFSSPSGVLVVDEPETHFHSLFAVQLWNALEDARPDIRFVYVTHDLTFALSRRKAQYVLASPILGLREIALDDSLPSDVSEALLGSASLSFYASRIVFCEGNGTSLDSQLYNAWFGGPDTVVRSVIGHQSVIRCVSALESANIATGLEVIGIIDRDFHRQAFIDALPTGIFVLTVHEVESLFALPTVVSAIANHMGREFDVAGYLASVRASVSKDQMRGLAIERWKASIEPRLVGIVAEARKSIDDLDSTSQVGSLFEMSNWSFSPAGLLREEADFISNGLASSDVDTVFQVVPGKQLGALAATQVGMKVTDYQSLVLGALKARPTQPLASLGVQLRSALSGYLPAPAVSITVVVPL